MPSSAWKKRRMDVPLFRRRRRPIAWPLRVVGLAAVRHLIRFFFNDTPTTEIYTLSLHDALPIFVARAQARERQVGVRARRDGQLQRDGDRKSTRLNSSHVAISYAVFCLKKKKQPRNGLVRTITNESPQ